MYLYSSYLWSKTGWSKDFHQDFCLSIFTFYHRSHLTSNAENSRPTNAPFPRANRPPPFPFPKQNRKVEKSNLVKHGSSNPNASQLIRQQTLESKANTHSENQQFLKEIVTNVLEGQGIGWLKNSRFKKLMEDENYRNFVLSRLNTNLDKKYSDEDDHIEDVVREILSFLRSNFVAMLFSRKFHTKFSKAWWIFFVQLFKV